MLSFNIFWGCCLIIWELQNQTCYLLCPQDSLCLEAESQPETKWSLKHISKDCVANYHYAGHLEHCPKVEAISDHYLIPSFLNSNIKLLVFKGMPCHMCEWVCCLLCFRRTHVPTTRSCLNIHTAVFVIPNYLPMESCCHTSKTRVTCGIRLAIFSWWSGSNFMSSVLLVSIFKRGYFEKQKKGFFQKQMSDAHSWQRMLKTQSVHEIVTSRFCLFKNKGQNSPVH